VYTESFLRKEDTMMVTEPRTDRPAVKLFNGRYTIESTKTGEHRTFWIETQAKDAKLAPDGLPERRSLLLHGVRLR
jgi:hypothetical protein